MLYYFIRPWVVWYAKYLYSKTFFTGMDKMPDNQPLILAINHPTAFTEFAYFGSATPKGRNFMLRGDLFLKSKFVAAILRSIKCIPIYRTQDGMANLKKNEDILNYCYELLSKGDNIMIAAEGDSKLEKRLRTIQKGTARMAFGAYEKHGRTDIAIIPVSVNYTAANTFRSKIYADFGPPIPLSDFFADHEKNPRRAIKLLTDRIGIELRKRVLHIEDPADDSVVDRLMEVMENEVMDRPLPLLTTQPSRLFYFIEKVNNFNTFEPEQKQEIKQKTKTYFDEIAKLDVKDIGIAHPHYYNWKLGLALIVGYIPFLIGRLTHYPVTSFPRSFTDKNVKDGKFYFSTQLGLGAVLYSIYLPLIILLTIIFTNWMWILFALLLPYFGHFSVLWYDYAQKWKAAKKATQLNPAQLADLQKERRQLISSLDKSGVT